MHHGVSSGSRRRRPGTPGPSCSGSWPVTPRSRSCTSRPTRNAGAAVGELYPGSARRLRATSGTRRSTRPTCAGLDLVFCLLPHGASQALLPDLLDHVGHAVDLGADFRLPARRVRALVRRAARSARELVDRFAYGLVELYRDEIATHAHVAVAGLLPDRDQPRVRAAARARPRRAAHHRRRGLGCLGRGPRAQDHEPVLGGERERLRLRLADAPSHRRDGAGAHEGRPPTRAACCSRRISCRRRAASSPPVTRVRRPRASRPHACSSTTASSTPTIRAWSWSTSRRAPRRRTAPTSRT